MSWLELHWDVAVALGLVTWALSVEIAYRRGLKHGRRLQAGRQPVRVDERFEYRESGVVCVAVRPVRRSVTDPEYDIWECQEHGAPCEFFDSAEWRPLP